MALSDLSQLGTALSDTAHDIQMSLARHFTAGYGNGLARLATENKTVQSSLAFSTAALSGGLAAQLANAAGKSPQTALAALLLTPLFTGSFTSKALGGDLASGLKSSLAASALNVALLGANALAGQAAKRYMGYIAGAAGLVSGISQALLSHDRGDSWAEAGLVGLRAGITTALCTTLVGHRADVFIPALIGIASDLGLAHVDLFARNLFHMKRPGEDYVGTIAAGFSAGLAGAVGQGAIMRLAISSPVHTRVASASHLVGHSEETSPLIEGAAVLAGGWVGEGEDFTRASHFQLVRAHGQAHATDRHTCITADGSPVDYVKLGYADSHLAGDQKAFHLFSKNNDPTSNPLFFITKESGVGNEDHLPFILAHESKEALSRRYLSYTNAHRLATLYELALVQEQGHYDPYLNWIRRFHTDKYQDLLDGGYLMQSSREILQGVQDSLRGRPVPEELEPIFAKAVQFEAPPFPKRFVRPSSDRLTFPPDIPMPLQIQIAKNNDDLWRLASQRAGYQQEHVEKNRAGILSAASNLDRQCREFIGHPDSRQRPMVMILAAGEYASLPLAELARKYRVHIVSHLNEAAAQRAIAQVVRDHPRLAPYLSHEVQDISGGAVLNISRALEGIFGKETPTINDVIDALNVPVSTPDLTFGHHPDLIVSSMVTNSLPILINDQMESGMRTYGLSLRNLFAETPASELPALFEQQPMLKQFADASNHFGSSLHETHLDTLADHARRGTYVYCATELYCQRTILPKGHQGGYIRFKPEEERTPALMYKGNNPLSLTDVFSEQEGIGIQDFGQWTWNELPAELQPLGALPLAEGGSIPGRVGQVRVVHGMMLFPEARPEPDTPPLGTIAFKRPS